ncbi:hypothetical protein O181_015694 [Austropuccinia psidii MF-1]|uniref:Uncharacterized protein n=1 Tax=Austropuccinia psidii MF-1 TaxID=1389203 RepID=A0A9Q3C0D5_9BASI|nr:hypothetical protein [Austropuccinia psidii MF-1]
MWLEPELDYSKLIPFGYKVHVLKLTNTSKVAERTTMLCAMTNKKSSDAMRFLDIDLGKIVISRYFIVPSTFKSSIAQKWMETLPNEIRSPQHQWVKLPAPKIPNSTITNSDDNVTSPIRRDPEPMARAQGERMKGWDYFPHYDTAPKNISSSINQQNIIADSCRTATRRNQALLTNVVPYSKAIGDTQEKEK